jgi:hypothetical protein
MATERLREVAASLAEATAHPDEHGRVRLPVVQPRDAAGLIAITHAELDAAIERREAAAASESLPIACSRGCSSCCVSPLIVTEGEAVAVAEWLRDPANAAVRSGYEAAYPLWRQTLGPLVETAGTATTEAAQRAWAIEAKQRRAMCAFNHDGACTIYPVRPGLCRKAHALFTNAHCGPSDGSGGDVKYYNHAETEETYERQESLRGVLHHALRPGKPIEMLCAAVHRLLAPTIGRNDPCTCGSGKKYKKCCGA